MSYNIVNSTTGPDNTTLAVFKGALYTLSPVNIPLALVIILHNTLIIRGYWPDKTRIIPLLFILIAGFDVALAQGQLILSAMSILLYTGHLAPSCLFPCVIYFQGIGAVGGVLSRVCNTILTVTKTINIVFPFKRSVLLANIRRVDRPQVSLIRPLIC